MHETEQLNVEREQLNLGGLTTAIKYVSQLAKYFDLGKLVASIPTVTKVFDKNPPLDSEANVAIWLDEVMVAAVAVVSATNSPEANKVVNDIKGWWDNPDIKLFVSQIVFALVNRTDRTPMDTHD
jgi:hypothetical protein